MYGGGTPGVQDANPDHCKVLALLTIIEYCKDCGINVTSVENISIELQIHNGKKKTNPENVHEHSSSLLCFFETVKHYYS